MALRVCDWEGLAGEDMMAYTPLPHQCSGDRLQKCIQGGFNLLAWQHRGRLFECTASVMTKYAREWTSICTCTYCTCTQRDTQLCFSVRPL